MPEHRGGKKNRKHGGTKKQPAQQRYTAERRWEKNKARKLGHANAFRSWCGKVREKFGKVKDTMRRIRELKGK